ncbi:unnamed protein product [Pseudo-nitzschia multistriata]|uniref:Glycosyl transferase family 25 domain-containing protein n=1 Tax=Pseudo-nitzschia multistriata TaxID=183589 RepID=A0A448YV93_9STRA|nr:unnamed protein product [Pseudo-nitzschia multistriata]
MRTLVLHAHHRRENLPRLSSGLALFPSLLLVLTLLSFSEANPWSASSSLERTTRPTSHSQTPPQRRLWRRSLPLTLHVINLDRDTERWETVVTELVAKGVPRKRIRRVSAVSGRDLSPGDLRANTTRVARTVCTPGTIGCFLSHRKVWQETEDGPEPYRVVLEDDVVVAPGFLEKVRTVVREIDEACEETRDGNWDVVFLGALGCVHPEGRHGLNRIAAFFAGGGRVPRRTLEGAPHCHVPRRPLGAHAFVLSKRGAGKLLKGCSRASGHVDVVAWGMPDLGVVSVHPMLAHQNNTGSPSTIGAVTGGIETRIPNLVVDPYTGLVLEWIYNAPVLSLGPVLLTMGRSVLFVLGGYLASALLYNKCPWLIVLHSIVVAILVALTKATTLRHGRGDETSGVEA